MPNSLRPYCARNREMGLPLFPNRRDRVLEEFLFVVVVASRSEFEDEFSDPKFNMRQTFISQTALDFPPL
jgi:hypothetical protein